MTRTNRQPQALPAPRNAAQTAPSRRNPRLDDFDFAITQVLNRPGAVGGAWVRGRVMGFRFEALVFPEHAADPAHEYERSRISKLWLQHTTTRQVAFDFDRGLSIPATDEWAVMAVDLLEGALAMLVYNE
jgi:hypothetical protein